MYSLHHAGHDKHQACSSRTPPRDIDFSDVSLKTLLVLVLRSIFHPSHTCLMDSSVLPTSSLPPATACEQSVCGRPPGQPQRCSALIHEELMTGPSVIRMSDDNVSKQRTTSSIIPWPPTGMSRVLCKDDYERPTVKPEGARDV